MHKTKWCVQLSKVKSNRVLRLELFFLTHHSWLRAHSFYNLRFTCPSDGLGGAQTCPSGYLTAESLHSAGNCQWWNPNSTSPPGPRSWATLPPRHQRKNCPETRPQNRSLWEQWQTAQRQENVNVRCVKQLKKNLFLQHSVFNTHIFNGQSEQMKLSMADFDVWLMWPLFRFGSEGL